MNRWIQLGTLLPWDQMVEVFVNRFSPTMGAGAVNPHWVIGAFIIKHKLGLSLIGGYLTYQTISWDAFNKASDLQDQAETYRLLTGHYPELIQCDKIYHTNDNRTWCSQRDIRMTTLPQRKKNQTQPYQKRKHWVEYAENNHIEGRIGNAKQTLSLNQVKAKLQGTSETWIAATLFVLNLSAFAARSGVTF